MRKYRISGVALIALLGVGAASQRPQSPITISHGSDPFDAHELLPPTTLTAEVQSAADAKGTKPQDLLRLASPAYRLYRSGTSSSLGLLPLVARNPDQSLPTNPVPPSVPVPPATPPASPAPAAIPAPTPPPAQTPPPTPSNAPVQTVVATPTPTPSAAQSANASSAAWQALRICESGDNYSTDTGNGYYGAYQFALSTWQSLGYSGLPSQATPAVQDAAAQRLYDIAGWSPWPVCSAQLGLG